MRDVPWAVPSGMGRTSYETQDEVVRAAEGMRRHEIPCDVIHIDTHWTDVPFRSDFRFSPARFPDPERLVERLRELGMRLSLWQFPYLHPADELHAEAIDKELVILASNGKPPVDDAILEATEAVHGWNLQWARAAWAGSQRWPLHFGGDAESTDNGLAATIRAGLSIALSGFPFWGHFIGGFPKSPAPGLYLRWLAFGALSPFMRCHGQAAARAVGVRPGGLSGPLPAHRPVALRAQALPPGAGARELAHRPVLDAPAPSRVSGGPGFVASGRRVPARARVARRSDAGGGAGPVGLPAAGRVARLVRRSAHEGPGWREPRAAELPIVLLRRAGG